MRRLLIVAADGHGRSVAEAVALWCAEFDLAEPGAVLGPGESRASSKGGGAFCTGMSCR